MTARLEIHTILEQARQLAARVDAELPGHDGLKQASRNIADAAERAEQVTRAMRRPWSLHRLPVVFLTVALVALAVFLWWEFGHVATLTLAIPDRDATEIRQNLRKDQRLDVRLVEVPGSREAVRLLAAGEVDLGFVQGGLAVPDGLLRLELRSRELVLLLLRDRVASPAEVHTVLTSVEGEGSHTVAQQLFSLWGLAPSFVHEWKSLTSDAAWAVPEAIDAVLVVKDPSDERTLRGVERLVGQGFRLAPVELGARGARFDFFERATVPAGFLVQTPATPPSELATVSVATWLVARQGLTPRVLTQAREVIQPRVVTIADRSFRFSATDTAELLQGVDATFSILVNIGLAFIALLGLDVITFRRRFHELNSLVSVISVLQSNKDVLGVAEPTRSEHLLYLGLCSDLLGLISVITGYYTQENSGLLFSTLSEVVHERCASLKINIQLKLLHAMVPR